MGVGLRDAEVGMEVERASIVRGVVLIWVRMVGDCCVTGRLSLCTGRMGACDSNAEKVGLCGSCVIDARSSENPYQDFLAQGSLFFVFLAIDY